MDILTPATTAPLLERTHTSAPRGRRAFVVGAVMAGLLLSFNGAGAAPDQVSAAEGALERATIARREADTRVAERQATVTALGATLGQLGEVDAALTQDLADARRQLREYAVAAYIDGGQSEMFRSSLSPEQASALAWQANLSMGQSSSADEAAERFQDLKETNSPARLTAAAELDDATRELQEAQFDAIQAAAFERDAEAALAAAQAAARDAARVAAAAAAADAKSKAQATTTVPRATTPRPAASPKPVAAAQVEEVAVETPAGSGAMGDPTPAESAILARIVGCESRGNYSIVSASGRYRGAYQFDYATWAGVGGTGDPAAASPAEQDYRALLLLRLRGSRPWPNCGH